jgi:hypothetical protein
MKYCRAYKVFSITESILDWKNLALSNLFIAFLWNSVTVFFPRDLKGAHTYLG